MKKTLLLLSLLLLTTLSWAQKKTTVLAWTSPSEYAAFNIGDNPRLHEIQRKFT